MPTVNTPSERALDFVRMYRFVIPDPTREAAFVLTSQDEVNAIALALDTYAAEVAKPAWKAQFLDYYTKS